MEPTILEPLYRYTIYDASESPEDDRYHIVDIRDNYIDITKVMMSAVHRSH